MRFSCGIQFLCHAMKISFSPRVRLSRSFLLRPFLQEDTRIHVEYIGVLCVYIYIYKRDPATIYNWGATSRPLSCSSFYGIQDRLKSQHGRIPRFQWRLFPRRKLTSSIHLPPINFTIAQGEKEATKKKMRVKSFFLNSFFFVFFFSI